MYEKGLIEEKYCFAQGQNDREPAIVYDLGPVVSKAIRMFGGYYVQKNGVLHV